jgi:NAD(P)H-dependent FMN reductase
MKIQVILASTRPGRLGERVAKWVTAAAADHPDFEVELVDLADYNLPHFNEPASPRFNSKRTPSPSVDRWLAKVAEADGYVIVTPEYNHSIPGVLKDALDFLDFQFAKKPVAIVSYGTVGGSRAAEQLKLILIEVKAAVVPEAISLIGAQGVLDMKGNFVGDATVPYGPNAALGRALGELAWWTQTLKSGRRQTVNA